MEVDKSTCWYDDNVVQEMNRALVSYKKIQDQTYHLTTLRSCVERVEGKELNLIDLGCGTGFASEYRQGHNYFGADLSHVINGCAMYNYPQYFYRYCDIVNDDLEFIRHFDIVLVNGVIDIMEYPLQVLDRVLSNCKDWVIIHRQEISKGKPTQVIKNPSYGGITFHSIINRNDFNNLIQRRGYRIVKEADCGFSNWEDNGTSFVLKRNPSRCINDLDRKLLKYVDISRPGFFIECGANDGVRQSVSLYFEEFLNWRGLLIEAVPSLYQSCIENRAKHNVFENCALVSPSYTQGTIDINYHIDSHGLMSYIENKALNPKETLSLVKTPALTLNAVLEQKKKYFSKIDLLVLDIEGLEKEALQGCDFNKWPIDLILVEEKEDTGIEQYLSQWYVKVDKLSQHDVLYKRK